jgi:hypothetical protein
MMAQLLIFCCVALVIRHKHTEDGLTNHRIMYRTYVECNIFMCQTLGFILLIKHCYWLLSELVVC